MSIDSHFRTPIYVQAPTDTFGGATTWTDVAGHNMGYIRVLSQSERASIDKPTLFSTHRVAMTKTVVPVYGQRLRIVEDGVTSYYMVKGVNSLSAARAPFQTVDCEVVQ